MMKILIWRRPAEGSVTITHRARVTAIEKSKFPLMMGQTQADGWLGLIVFSEFTVFRWEKSWNMLYWPSTVRH